MGVVLTNNASSTLLASIDNDDTSLTIQTADAAEFPALAGDQWFPASIIDVAGNREIVKVTARATATLTVVRAQEGTIAQSFAAGSRVDLVLTVAAIDALTGRATKEEAEAGIDPDKVMTPLRTKQAIVALSTAPGLERKARTSNTQIVLADHGSLIDITSGTFSQTFAAVAALGDGFWCHIRNSGDGDITLDPDGSETIDGLTSYVMYPGEIRLVQCDGTALRTLVLAPFSKVFTASGTFVKPPGYRFFDRQGWGGGGGGGGGNNGNNGAGGGSGGGGAAGGITERVSAASLPASAAVVVGAGGVGGTAPGTAATNGGNTTLNSWVVGRGGERGLPGNTTSSSNNIDGGRGGSFTGSGIDPGYGVATSYNATSFSGGQGSGLYYQANSILGGGRGGSLYWDTNGMYSHLPVPCGSSYFGGGGGGRGYFTAFNPSATHYNEAGGTSILAGAGGNGGGQASAGGNGQIPGGGGGGGGQGSPGSGNKGGDGGRGELRLWGVV